MLTRFEFVFELGLTSSLTGILDVGTKYGPPSLIGTTSSSSKAMIVISGIRKSMGCMHVNGFLLFVNRSRLVNNATTVFGMLTTFEKRVLLQSNI